MATRLLSTTGEELLLRNRLRKSWLIQNEDASINIFIKRERAATATVSSTDHDFIIPPGGTFGMDGDVDGTEAVQDRYTAIAASGTPRVAFFETEDQLR